MLQEFWNAFKASFRLFTKHDTTTLGAALSYYTVFSIAPIIIIVLSVTGALFGHQAVEGELQNQLQALFGNESAGFWQDIVKAAYKPGRNIIIAIVAVIVLIIGATSVFSQLRTSLNIIWGVRENTKKPIIRFVLDRVFSFAAIACLVFLMLVTLVIHSGLEAFAGYFDKSSPYFSATFLKIINTVISFGITLFLFSIIYRFMSDAVIKWKDVSWGSFFTSILFISGKYLIGVYLGKSNLTSEYGAAGSVVVVLLWVFYSSQIFFFGAEFIRALATERGVLLYPKDLKSSDKANA